MERSLEHVAYGYPFANSNLIKRDLKRQLHVLVKFSIRGIDDYWTRGLRKYDLVSANPVIGNMTPNSPFPCFPHVLSKIELS